MSVKTLAVAKQADLLAAFDGGINRSKLAAKYGMSQSTLRRRIPEYRKNVAAAGLTVTPVATKPVDDSVQIVPAAKAAKAPKVNVQAPTKDGGFKLSFNINAVAGHRVPAKTQKMNKVNIMRQIVLMHNELEKKEILTKVKETAKAEGIQGWSEASLNGAYRHVIAEQTAGVISL